MPLPPPGVLDGVLLALRAERRRAHPPPDVLVPNLVRTSRRRTEARQDEPPSYRYCYQYWYACEKTHYPVSPPRVHSMHGPRAEPRADGERAAALSDSWDLCLLMKLKTKVQRRHRLVRIQHSAE
jgi:hypothetical protein